MPQDGSPAASFILPHTRGSSQRCQNRRYNRRQYLQRPLHNFLLCHNTMYSFDDMTAFSNKENEAKNHADEDNNHSPEQVVIKTGFLLSSI